jgi:hypothetical protein
MKSKLKGQVNIILIATAELKLVTETIEADYIAKDLQSLIDWSEEEYKKST